MKGIHVADRWRRWTPQVLDAMSGRVAASLVEDHGLSAGQTVALIDMQPVEFVVAMMGIMRAGGVAVPVSDLLPDLLVTEVLIDCQAIVVIAGRSRRRPMSLKRVGFWELTAPAAHHSRGRPGSIRHCGSDVYIRFDGLSKGCSSAAP